MNWHVAKHTHEGVLTIHLEPAERDAPVDDNELAEIAARNSMEVVGLVPGSYV